jgi:hypothetical protein
LGLRLVAGSSRAEPAEGGGFGVSLCGVADEFGGVGSWLGIVVVTLAACLMCAEAGDAASWSVKAVAPLPAAGGQLTGISCPSATACEAVGFYPGTGKNQFPAAERWNRSKWSIQSSGRTNGYLYGLACPSRRNCIAVGYESATDRPLVERWNGSRWSITRLAGHGALNGVSCSSTRACTAVGSDTGTGPGGPLVERWNGRTWQRQKIHAPAVAAGFDTYLSGVACPSATECLGVGVADNLAFAERWTGRSWSPQSQPSLSNSDALSDVSCTTAKACVAVGGTDFGTFAERWNGTRWSVQRTPNPAGGNSISLVAVSCSSAKRCTAVGTAPSGPFAERYS